MTNSPPEPTETPSPRPRRRTRLWVGLVLGLVGAGGAWIGFWALLQHVAQPFVEKQVGNTLDRSLELGAITKVTWNQVHFGPTTLTPTPEQTNDADRGEARSVEVKFTPLKVLFQKRLELDITLREATAYLDQNTTGEWLNIPKFPEGDLPIKIRLSAIRVREAKVEVAKRDDEQQLTPPVQLAVEGGNLLLYDAAKDMEITQLRGEFAKGGRFRIDGTLQVEEGTIDSLAGKLAIQVNALNLAEVSRLLPTLPAQVLNGRVNANLNLRLDGNPLELETLPEIYGIARLQDIAVKVDQLDPIATVARGDVRLQGETIQLDGWRTKLGDLPVQIEGSATKDAANIAVNLAPTEIATLQETFALENLPIAVQGAIAMTANITGALAELAIVGRVFNPNCNDGENCQPLQIDRVPIEVLVANFRIDVPDQSLQLANLRIQPAAGGRIQGQGSATLKGNRAAVARLTFTELAADGLIAPYVENLPVAIGQVSGAAEAYVPLDDWQQTRATITVNALGGTVTVGEFALEEQQWQATVTVDNLGLPEPLPVAQTNARLRVGGRLDAFAFNRFTAQGQVQTRFTNGSLTLSRLNLAQGQFTAQLDAQNAEVGAIAIALLPPPVNRLPVSTLNGSLAIAGRLNGRQLPDVTGRGEFNLGLATGTASLSNFALTNNQLTAEVTTAQVRLGDFLALLPQKLPVNAAALGRADAAIALRANLAPLLQGRFNAFLSQAELAGTVAIADFGGGTGRAQFQLRQNRWQSEVSGDNIDPTEIVPQLPPRLRDPVAGNFQLAGTLPERFTLNGLDFSGNGRVTLAQGRFTVPQIQLRNGQVQARAVPENVALRPFSPLLRGQLVGDVTVIAPLTKPLAFSAQGEVKLSEGVSLVTQPLTVAFQWREARLTLDRVEAPEQLSASGFIAVNFPALRQGRLGLDLIRDLNLTVDARDLPLAAGLAELQDVVALPTVTQGAAVTGSASFQGTIRGSLRAPDLVGNLLLKGVAVNGFALEPEFGGPIAASPDGVTLNLAGDRDRLDLALDGQYLPLSLTARIGELEAAGARSGNQFEAEVNNVDLAQMKRLVPFAALTFLPQKVAAQPLGGRLSGRFALDLTTWGLSGNVAIANPEVGPLRADAFTGGVQYVGGAIALEDAQLRTGETIYAATGRFVPFGPNPQIEGQVEITQGNLQDVLAALRLTKLTDVVQLSNSLTQDPTGNAADLATARVGEPGTPISQQLSRLSEIRELIRQNQAQSIDNLPLPPLESASGAFNATLTLGGSLKDGFDGLEGTLTLEGADWGWGSYLADRVTLRGSLREGTFAIQPLELITGEGQVLLTGLFGADNINGQLQITDFPIVTLQDLIPLPPAIGLGGEINLTATLAGNRANPQAKGQVSIVGANINDTPIHSATANFGYSNAVLIFGGRSTLIEDGTPLTATGRIPFQLPIPGTSPPQDYRIVIDAQVQDDGLGILNVLTRRRLAWLGGEGEVDVEITGQLNPETNRLDSLVADGQIVLNGGVMGSKFLQQQITDLTGTIALNLDRIEVEQLTGSFGGGAIAIAGSLPTFERVPQDNPLTVQLAQLAVELPGAFRGDIAGQVQILGSALNPEVTGDIGVSNGNVQLLGVAALTQGETAGGESAIAAGSRGFLEFRELNISLTDDFVIRQFPILELVARGDLTVNGILPFIEPEGEIALTRGYVNIFTTTFRLDGDYENRALLSPITGIDPYLDLRLVGSVIETQRRTLAVESFSSEVADNFNVGTSQSLQVRAEVQASALELVETLRTSAATGQRPGRRLIALRSSPSRSETEILALLGGTFINSVAGGNDDAIVGGIANIAGNALLGDIQASIARALSLTEFRVFPAPVIEPESKTPTGELGVALEIGKTVFDRASVSVVQFVTPGNQPTRFNVRYRINDSFTVRGTTDFRGDDRAVIEFETRF